MSTSCFDREDGLFRVLVNHEEQYSIWSEWKAIPGGWREAGVQGDRKACLDHVDKTWTDARRRFLQQVRRMNP
jgi:MbtH protein